MIINVNVNIKLEETPALINCFSAFCEALQNVMGAVGEPAPVKAASKKTPKKTAPTEVVIAPEIAIADGVSTADIDIAEKVAEALSEPEKVEAAPVEEAKTTEPATAVVTSDEVKAACMDFKDKNPDRKKELADCFGKVGATKLSEVPAEKLAELLALVKAL